MYFDKGNKMISELDRLNNEYFIDKEFFGGNSNYYTGSEIIEATDYQGIPWKTIFPNNTRRKFRERRCKTNVPYRSISNPPLRRYPPKMLYERDSIFGYNRFYKLKETYIGHFQLRNNLIAPTQQNLIFTTEKGYSQYCMQNCTRNYNNLHDELRPTGISMKRDLLGLAGISGELILCNVKDGKTVYQSIITEQDSINNFITMEENSTGGVWVVNGSNDKKIRIFDINSMEMPLTIIPFDDPVNFVSLSPNKQLALVMTDNVDGYIFDFTSNKIVKTLKGHLDFGFTGDWNPNGIQVATGNQDVTCRVWDIRNESKEIQTLQGEVGCILNVKYANGGDSLVCGENMDFVNIYDVRKDYEYYQQIDVFGEIAGTALDMITGDYLYIMVHIKEYGGIFEFKIRDHSPIETLENSML
jgi:WD40 repeat protein